VAGNSLTGIFAPGSAPLSESLRTLAVEPKRVVIPGETIRVRFSFSNFGGAIASGVRVRFAQPSGVTALATDDTIDDRPLTEGGSFTDAGGALAGDLEPNQQCVVACSFLVNETIEDGSVLVFQAALVSDRTPLVASNRERIVVRSRPSLQNTSTVVSLSAPERPRPGDTIAVRAAITNNGSSSAHDIVLLMPTPQHTTYVARSARIDGRTVHAVDGEPFDYGSAAIVSERLAPGQSIGVEYQATIDSPLDDETAIKANASIGSRECGEFELASNEIVVASPADFSGDESSLTLFCDDTVEPGTRIPMLVRAVNGGTGSAERTAIAFSLPDGLTYAAGSATIDGQPVADESIADLVFNVGTVPAGRVVEAGICATVAVPRSPDEPTLVAEAALAWRGGERNFARRLALRTAPRFNRARNNVQAQAGVAQARDDVRFSIRVLNDGTAPEENVRLRLLPGVHLDDVRIGTAGEEAVPYREPLDLGDVAPHCEREFTVLARIASRVPDRSNVTLGAVLEFRSGVADLGTASVLVRSRPQVARESIAWEIASNETLRPQRVTDVLIRFTNSGSDVLRDARLVLNVPPELAVERAIDARRDREGLSFGEVGAETSHQARVTLRLLRPVAGNGSLAIQGWLCAKGISPLQLAPLEIPVFAQADFAASAQFLAFPGDTVNPGDRVAYELRLRNDGDGPADALLVRAVPTDRAVYVPGSTTINGVELDDDGGLSPLWSRRGLVLTDVDPAAELRIRFEMHVIAPARAGTALETRAVLEWADRTLALAAPAIEIETRPQLGETIVGTPFSVARAFGREEPVPPAREAAVAPQIAPLAQVVEAPPVVALPRAIAEVITARAELPPPPPIAAPLLYVDFPAERLAHTVKMLERSNAGGLVAHLFALRMLAPEHAFAETPALDSKFAAAARAMRAPLERLFVRLRMPRLAISAKDLEDEQSRIALRSLLETLLGARASATQAPDPDLTRIEGTVDAAALRTAVAQLENAPLGAAASWIAGAQLLGTVVTHQGDRRELFAGYRERALAKFAQLSTLPLEDFHQAIVTERDEALDASLARALAALRSEAALTASY
jgi:uncharacterized repeat protein (TIGR01451 family)